MVNRLPGEDACWLWTGATNNKGYPIFDADRKGGSRLAHRFAYEHAGGTIPEGQDLRHSCDNPICVRPSHLTPGTRKQNMEDMVARGRSPKGERSGSRKHPERLRRGSAAPWSKLTEADVQTIRRRCAAGELQKDLAAEYGVNPSNIGQIVRRISWQHVP